MYAAALFATTTQLQILWLAILFGKVTRIQKPTRIQKHIRIQKLNSIRKPTRIQKVTRIQKLPRIQKESSKNPGYIHNIMK